MLEESYLAGDVVRKTASFAGNYPSWKAEEGTIVSAKVRLISDVSLASTDKTMFRSRYGTQEKYPIFELIVQVGNSRHQTSQFGFNKD